MYHKVIMLTSVPFKQVECITYILKRCIECLLNTSNNCDATNNEIYLAFTYMYMLSDMNVYVLNMPHVETPIKYTIKYPTVKTSCHKLYQCCMFRNKHQQKNCVYICLSFQNWPKDKGNFYFINLSVIVMCCTV